MSNYRRINIIPVEFGENCNIVICSRYQYDKGQIIKFLDVSDGIQVEFSNDNHERAEPYIIQDGQVQIPDFLLEENNQITAYVKMVDENSETTIKTITIPVESRPEANTGIAPENEQTFIEQIQEIMTDTKAIAEGVRTDADEGKFSYILTEEDKRKIAQEAGKSVDLSNYVTNTRRIANKELSTDITANDIILAMQDLTIFYVAVLKAMSQQTNIKQYFSLTSVLGEINKSFYSKPQIDNFFKEMNTSIESKIGDVNTILANVVEV